MAGLLAAASYDPGTAATASTTSLLAMTALDTTNLRKTFTAPASGYVVVRARVAFTGATTAPQILLGVLEGATVVARMAPTGQTAGAAASLNAGNVNVVEFYAVVPGVGAGSHTWDLAYGVEIVSGASGVLKWGGPNDASGADAWGAASFEIYDPGGALLGAKLYDPSVAVTQATNALLAMTALDTTNLRLTITAPASGNIFWRIRTVMTGATTAPIPGVLLGILESTTVVARQAPGLTFMGASGGTFPYWVLDASGVMTGVTAGSHTYDASYAVQLVGGSANEKIKYGGPNDTTTDNAWGGIQFALWTA